MAMRPFPIFVVQLSPLIINEDGIHSAVSTDRTTLAPGDDMTKDVNQHLPVEKEPPTDNNKREHNTQTAYTKYALDQLADNERLKHYLCYEFC